MGKRAAVLLTGCGYLDGTEIHEATLSYLALAEHQIAYHSFAPNKEISEVVSHLTRKKEHGRRNSLEESARLARGDVSPLEELDSEKYDLLWIPGGIGITSPAIEKEVVEIISQFHKEKKPIVAICIAPMVVAKALREYKPHLTVGRGAEANCELKQLGAVCHSCASGEIAVDLENHLYSAPGYMEPPNIVQIYQSLCKIAKILC